MTFLRLMAVAAIICLARGAGAVDVTGYSAVVNDRFTSGFPSSPVANSNGSFVGAG